MALSNEEKKALLAKYKESQKKVYILKEDQVESLFDFVEERIQVHGCDNTLRFARQWLNANVEPEKHPAILAEFESMGGHCDCEVLSNCYEDYDIE